MKKFFNSKTFKIFIIIWGAFILFPSWGSEKGEYIGKYFLFTPPAIVFGKGGWQLSSAQTSSFGKGRNDAVLCLSIMFLQSIFLSGATLVSYLIETKKISFRINLSKPADIASESEPKKSKDHTFFPM